MTRKREDDKQPKKPTGRNARLAAALRENLRRRKAQERRRNAPCPRRVAEVRLSPYLPGEGAIRLPGYDGAGGRGEHGSNTHCRRTAPERHDPDIGRQERHAAADDREPADRGHADPRERAAARRRHSASTHPRQSRRRRHDRRQAAGRRSQCRPHHPYLGQAYRRHHRALRPRVQDAGQLLGGGAAAGAHGRGQGVDAGRLRHRHAAGRSA